MNRPLSIIVFALSISACAGSRKGADAGGGPATTGGTSGTPGSAGTAREPGAAPAPTATGTPAANTAGTASSGQGAAQGEPCDDGKCAAGLECISYYGIAGGSGPKFTSCEIRCDVVTGKPRCPAGQSCVTIADGPGSVCRRSDM